MTSRRVGAVACANGLGHVKRQVVVLDRLRATVPDVTLLCAAWQIEALRDWEPFAALPAVETIETPVVWYDDPGAYGDWLVDWQGAMGGWALDRFDVVWSDNLVEPLAVAPDRTVLGGSFLWHDVLATAHPGTTAVERYAAWCTDLLAAASPAMTASELFAMPAVATQTTIVPVGLTPLVERSARSTATTYVTFTGASPGAGRAAGAAAAVEGRLEAAGYTRVDDLDRAGVVVGRAGLGTVSDAVARRLPLVLLEDHNPEIAHNRARAIELGLAVGVDDLDGLDAVGELADEALSGADDIAAVLAARAGA